MPALLLELFSEEIPARMQTQAADDLARLVTQALGALTPIDVRTFAGPRRIALTATVAASLPAVAVNERGPRATAPETAVAGFRKKYGAGPSDVRIDGEYWVYQRQVASRSAADLIAAELPGIIRTFPWKKRMRWGTSTLTWVRPLRRLLCILDGVAVPFSLVTADDDGHGMIASNLTEGHRQHAPGVFPVSSVQDWATGLGTRYVVVDAAERRSLIADGMSRLATDAHLTLVPDDGLLDEVTGLVEWPVPLLGRIDAAFMDLPPEVMQVSMRVNQRYFALRHADGTPAARFAFVANIEAPDGGVAIVAGNERVLRARFSDARHFWDLDRQTPLADRIQALDAVTFHAKLGSQGDRVRRMVQLAGVLAPLVGADPIHATRATLLAKADLTTGMVGEFPELQGVMGGYYAHTEGLAVAHAIATHYAPKSPTDPVPDQPVAIAVALADKLDQLGAFFAVGEAPTGSGDPFGLRRAALGVIRIIRDNALRIPLRPIFDSMTTLPAPAPTDTLLAFIADRLRVQLRSDGARHDVLSAVFAAGADDDLTRLLARTAAVTTFLATADGADLLATSKRAANILRIEDKKDGPHLGPVDPALLSELAEHALSAGLDAAELAIAHHIAAEEFQGAMTALAALRPNLDTFFEQVTVNAPDPAVRRNRLRLLARVGATMAAVADFSRIEG